MRNVMQKLEIPDEWDRSGLPAWTYFSDELLELETEVLFRHHWQLACHLGDLPEPGSYVTDGQGLVACTPSRCKRSWSSSVVKIRMPLAMWTRLHTIPRS